MHGGERRRIPRCIAPPRDVWGVGGCRCEIDSARGRDAKGRERFHPDRKAYAALGYSCESEWHGGIWVGRAFAGDVDGGGGAAAGVWRKSGEGGCQRGVEDSRREGGGADSFGGGGDCGGILAGESGARQAES